MLVELPEWRSAGPRHSGLDDSGTYRRASDERNLNEGGSTPTTVMGTPFTRIVRPIAPGSAFRRRRQYSSVAMTTRSAPGVISASVNARPMTGATPSVLKKPVETRITSTRSVAPASPTMALAGR